MTTKHATLDAYHNALTDAREAYHDAYGAYHAARATLATLDDARKATLAAYDAARSSYLAAYEADLDSALDAARNALGAHRAALDADALATLAVFRAHHDARKAAEAEAAELNA